MRRFILLMLLAWLPVQASAMPWLASKCDQHESGTHGHAAQHGGHAHHSDPAGSDGDELATANGAHTCCHHFFSGAAHTVAKLTDAAIAAGVASHPPARLYEFLPDLPKRPPLADLA